jgi:hypothetical protein
MSGVPRRKIEILDPHGDEIRKLAAEGLSDARIADALPVDVDGQMVLRWRTKNGVEKGRTKFVSVLDPFADDIRRMYLEEKLTDEVIAERLPVEITGNSVTSYRVRKLGIATDRDRRVGRFVMEARFEEVKDQLPAAWERSKRWHRTQKREVRSAKRVGEEFGVSASTARDWLGRLGLVERRIDGKEAGDRALALFNENWSVPRIAAELGATQDSVRNWLKARECDLSNHTKRMSHEEWIAWRRRVSEGKAAAIAGSGRYRYGAFKLDSPQEVVFVKNCDRLGLQWLLYDRAEMGVCEVTLDDEMTGRYAPDIVVEGIPVEVKGIYDKTAATKVRTWREVMGDLALIMKEELFAFEAAADAAEAMVILKGACYLDPEPEQAFWEREH